MPPDPEGQGTKSGDPNSRYAPVTKTVSVLNLEALGYLPPAIANDVRLLARSSWAAQWDYFNFDAGRYAFCAVNVSDFLDVTKIAADAPRTSAAAAHPQSSNEKPQSRFSLAHLFRGSFETGSQKFQNGNFSDSDFGSFDNYVHVSRRDWNSAPLVSLMDYNLSIGNEGFGKSRQIWSQFYRLANGDNKTAYLYENTVENSPDVKGAERQPFVTDSWFPSSELDQSDGTANTPLDITRSAPFSSGLLENDTANLLTVLNDTSSLEFWKTMYQNGHAFCMLDPFTLFDYLDKNDVPLSLAMPCAERVPMIAALAPIGNLQVEFVVAQPEDVPIDGDHKKKVYNTNIKITASGMGLASLLVYPFRDREGKPPVGCTAQAFARLVFVGEKGGGGGAGGATASVKLRNNGFARNFRPLNDAEWMANVDAENQFKLEEGSGAGVLSHTAAENSLVVTLPSQNSVSWTPSADMQNERDIWKEDALLTFKDLGTLEKTIISRIEYYKIEKDAQGNVVGEKRDPEKPNDYYQIALRPFDAEGNVIEIPADEMEKAAFDALCDPASDGYTIRPYLVTWARVVQDGKTVDMVPASYEDDKAFNNIDNTTFAFPDINDYFLGNTPPAAPGLHPMPIMRFQNAMSFTYADASAATPPPQQSEWVEKSCYAVDPRYNWAPENWWFDSDDANPSGQKWCEAVFGKPYDDPVARRKDQNSILNLLVKEEFQDSNYGRGDRANDPFLFVSNLGYLQSVGELAFLPHLSDMKEDGYPSSVLGDTWQNIQGGSHQGALYDGNPRMMRTAAPDQATLATMPCALAAWKSYQSFRTNPKDSTFEFGANLYRRGLVNGSQGFYVNPFTQSQEIMLAALANPPLNYWAAGTNYTGTGRNKLSDFSAYKNFMMSDNGGGVRMTGQDVNKIAMFLRRRFEDLASMIEIPQTANENDLYAVQKVWEDMFDALDWSGTLDITVEDVYEDLAAYYASSADYMDDYRRTYMRGSRSSYPSINHYARGGARQGSGVGVRLHTARAIHKDDFSLNADPLRGQYAEDKNDTSCYQDFFDVDRMFLHSYWRDCFANKQQLFLIFVRAESTALGGSGEGTPAQQGGRAVALVWRDPLPPFRPGSNPATLAEDIFEESGSSYYYQRHPHKMRILFYRQFE